MPVPPNSPGSPKKGGIKFNMYWAYAIIVVFLITMLYLDDNSMTKDVSYTKFEELVSSGGVKKITVFSNTNKAEAFLSDSLAQEVFKPQFEAGKSMTASIMTDIPSADKLQESIDKWREEGKFSGEVNYEKSADYTSLLWSFGPIVLLVVFWLFMMRRMSGRDGGGAGGVFNVGKSKAQIIDKGEGTNVTFKDVAGLTEAKTEIQEIVEFLRNPARYTDLGGKIP